MSEPHSCQEYGYASRFLRDQCCSHAKAKRGVIVERILDERTQQMHFEGALNICGLPNTLRPPMRLCSIEVTHIVPATVPCSCSKNTAIRLHLLCRVADSCGRIGTGSAVIEVKTCERVFMYPKDCLLRRGAFIYIRHASSFGFNPVDVCLDILLVTVLTGDTSIIRNECCPNPCPFPPLYPNLRLPASRSRASRKK